MGRGETWTSHENHLLFEVVRREGRASREWIAANLPDRSFRAVQVHVTRVIRPSIAEGPAPSFAQTPEKQNQTLREMVRRLLGKLGRAKEVIRELNLDRPKLVELDRLQKLEQSAQRYEPGFCVHRDAYNLVTMMRNDFVQRNQELYQSLQAIAVAADSAEDLASLKAEVERQIGLVLTTPPGVET